MKPNNPLAEQENEVSEDDRWLIQQHIGWLRIRAERLRENAEPGDAQNAEHAERVADALSSLTP